MPEKSRLFLQAMKVGIMIQIDEYAAEILAQIHLESIDPPWSEAAFRSFLKLPTVFGFAHPDFSSFILFSVVGEEAEILTFATQRKFRRQGRGKMLLINCLEWFFDKKIKKIFLEVNENNFSAINLYKQLDFKKYGVRESYYINSTGERSNALLMSYRRCEIKY